MDVRRLSIYTAGLLILSFGVALTILADTGIGAWDALHVGLSRHVGLTVGTWVMITGVCLIFINAVIAKRKPDWFALFTVFITGIFIDFWLTNFVEGRTIEGSFGEYIIFILGMLLIAGGIALYLISDISPNPVDQLMLALHERFGCSLMVSKTVTEVMALCLAVIFSGPVGVGTVLLTLCLGPLVQFFIALFLPPLSLKH